MRLGAFWVTVAVFGINAPDVCAQVFPATSPDAGGVPKSGPPDPSVRPSQALPVGTPLQPSGQAGVGTPTGPSNADIARQWSQTTTAAAPTLVPQDDGTTRVEWHGAVSFDNYTNDIRTQNSFGSALKPGNHSLMRLQSDLRVINDEAEVNYFQLGLTTTDDRAILSQYPRHIDTLQVGRSGAGYLVSLGDVAPNFSSLGSALGLKGLMAQRAVGQAAVSMYAGVVAPAWEFVERLVPQSQLLKEVQGVKVEYAFTNAFRAYATGQHGADLADNTGLIHIAPTRVNSGSVGFVFAEQDYQVTGETAYSDFEQDGSPSRRGGATILDAAWRTPTYAVRAGYHDLGANFSSLSYAARAGTREVYTGGDWMPASWLSFGADVRNSRNYSLPTFFVPSRMSDTDSGSLRANLSLGTDHPNWYLGLQSSASDSRDTLGNDAANEQHSINLNYAEAPWTASLGYATGRMSYSAFPDMSGRMDSWQAGAGRMFSDQNGFEPATWIINAYLSGNYQNQHLDSGAETKSLFSSLNLGGQLNQWGTLNLSLGTGFNTRPLGQSTLRMTTVQIDASRPLGSQGSIKVYVRDVRRNVNDVALFAEEVVTGLQVTYRF